jgi:hypothetical protein
MLLPLSCLGLPLLLLPCRQVILGNNPQWAPNVRIGVSTNYNKLCGMGACQNPSPFQKAAVQALYNAVDFVGLSSYPRFKNAVSDMEDATEIFNYEMLVGAAKPTVRCNCGGGAAAAVPADGWKLLLLASARMCLR